MSGYLGYLFVSVPFFDVNIPVMISDLHPSNLMNSGQPNPAHFSSVKKLSPSS